MELRVLIPKNAEAVAGAKMGQGPIKYVVVHDRNSGHFSELGKQGVEKGGSKRASRAKQGNALSTHPGRECLPIMKMTREEEGGLGLQNSELGLILKAQVDFWICPTENSFKKISR